MNINLTVSLIEITDLSEDDADTMILWEAGRHHAKHLILSCYECDPAKWEVRAYIRKAGFAPKSIIFPSEKAARSFIEDRYKDAFLLPRAVELPGAPNYRFAYMIADKIAKGVGSA